MTAAASRTFTLHRDYAVPISLVWQAWTDPDGLPKWWGPEGYSCRTKRIDIRAGGDWVFDMIGPDGTVYPNHQRFVRMVEGQEIGYQLLKGEDGPRHADATVRFSGDGASCRITLEMTLATQEEFDAAIAFGAKELGLQTLGKLAKFIGVA